MANFDVIQNYTVYRLLGPPTGIPRTGRLPNHGVQIASATQLATPPTYVRVFSRVNIEIEARKAESNPNRIK
jgi:hypothetical protein